MTRKSRYISRGRKLTAEEAEKYNEIRRLVMEEFSPIKSGLSLEKKKSSVKKNIQERNNNA